MIQKDYSRQCFQINLQLVVIPSKSQCFIQLLFVLLAHFVFILLKRERVRDYLREDCQIDLPRKVSLLLEALSWLNQKRENYRHLSDRKLEVPVLSGRPSLKDS